MPPFVGRTEPLARLRAVHDLVEQSATGVPRWPPMALVTGEAGIGKTALLARFSEEVGDSGTTVVWGVCEEGDQAPAWWPWTQALRGLLSARGVDPRDLQGLAALLPEGARATTGPPPGDGTARIRLFDEVAGVLTDLSDQQPVAFLLDDLQWADASTLELMRFLLRRPTTGRILLVGAYRPLEATSTAAAHLAALSQAAELIPLQGLDDQEVGMLVAAAAGTAAARTWAATVHARSGGHPFLARELCRLVASGADPHEVPSAVREVLLRDLGRVSSGCAAFLRLAAVAGRQLQPDVLADAAGTDSSTVAAHLSEAERAGLLTAATPQEGAAFVHDLHRETVVSSVPAEDRPTLHLAIARALENRLARGGSVHTGEIARHYAGASAVAPAGAVLRWARVAAEADLGRTAFEEAASHLERGRRAVTDAGAAVPEPQLVALLVEEADLRLRAGQTTNAKELLDEAWSRAVARDEGPLLARVALGLDRCGARFAMPRTELVTALHTALRKLAGAGTSLEAAVSAALARQLQHSVPGDRPRAGPLAARAVDIARAADDPACLATCLLAHHDVLWTPGTGEQRAAVAGEIVEVARRLGDDERLSQALLLLATAQLEQGSAAFRATFREYTVVTEGLCQPRQDYVLRTRLAALALLEGDVDGADLLSSEAASLGESVGERDSGNVRMSQRLEIVRARADPGELLELASEAVAWWVGAPAHAHGVAAGFAARAGDRERARRELDILLTLDDWRTDRSYLWSVFAGEVATAAIAVEDTDLCRDLLADLSPLSGACAVNGALVAFMGSLAHRVGQLHAAVGEVDEAREHLARAREVHRRLGAVLWENESHRALRDLDVRAPRVEMARAGRLWELRWHGRTAHLPDSKGIRDLAVLLSRPGEDVPALELAGAAPGLHASESGGARLDARAASDYRRRLEHLEEELEDARAAADLGRVQRATEERELLHEELRRSLRPDGTSRVLGPTPGERARKAVTARVRDAIARISEQLPELGHHLDRTVRTGTSCSYRPDQDR